ncbi:uncharacterized protein LOC123269670 [Cotesia glomerata]|uniref:uncharacterized protein LOC123269670 n=1 Tax=Cotesia glomerata TaxID=32391 RepID=UPI001D01ADB1|nr:uncharacterized protein LOC123269670 [Cotesia glomerata]
MALPLSLSTCNLKICHVNAQSLRNECHFELFKEYFRCHNYDIIAVSETWLNHLIPDDTVYLLSYTLYRHNRRLRSGGGVALYVRSWIKAKYVASSANLEDKHPGFCNCLDLHIVEFSPTHHLENSESWIDACIVDDIAKVLTSEQSSEPFISEHDLISVTYNYKVELQQLNSFVYRNWNTVDDNKLREMCEDVDYKTLSELNSANEMNTCLHAHIDRIVNIVAPEKLVVPRRPPAPRTGYAYKEYSHVRRSVKQRITEAKKKYFDCQLINARNSRELWNDLRRLGLSKQKDLHTIIKVDLNELNQFFVCASGNFMDLDVDTSDILITDNNEIKFTFEELNTVTIRKSIMRLTSNSVGSDGFSIRSYKCILPFFLEAITDLFNVSLSTGVFPEDWKLSHVIPIPKKAYPSNCEDYRPISLLPNFSKALERCVHDQFVKYINENNYFDEYQTAFREGLGTQTAVIKFCDDIKLAVNESKVTIAVSFDLSKAFDSVNHKRLLSKLLLMNFSNSAVEWVKSYLTKRKQSVRSNKNISSWEEIVSGVPQGSTIY